MITFAELMTELQKLGKQKSAAQANAEKRERNRKDPGGQAKKIKNKKYRMSAKGKMNAKKAKKAALKGKTATGRDMVTQNVSGRGGRDRLKQKKLAQMSK